MARHTQPSPPPDDDVFFRVLGAVFRLAWAAIRYLLGRSIRQPLIGLLYLGVALPTAILLVQHGRMALAVATAPPYTRPAPVFPLTAPLPDPVPLLLLGLVGLVVGFDRWCAWRTRARPPLQVPPPTPPPEVCVLGRAHHRTWDATRNSFTLAPADLFTLTEEHLRTHLLVIAPQGGGKTQSILLPLFFWCQRIEAACVVFDAKGDGQDWRPTWFDLTFDLTQPATSMRLSIWSGRTPRQAGERLGEALIDPQATPEYFLNVAKDALAGLVAAHYAAFGQMPMLQQLLLYLRSAEARADLVSELRRAGRGSASDEVADLLRLDQLAGSKGDVLGTLDTALTPLARGDIAPLLATDLSGYGLDELLRQGVRVRFALPVADYPRLAPILGRLVLAQFTDAVLSPACNRELTKMIIVDEAHNFITPTIAKGMAMARSNRGSYVLAMQNLNQIKDPALREDLVSVSGNKIVMAGVGNYDAEEFSKLFGAQELEYTSASTSHSTGTNTGRTTGRGQQGGGLLGSSSGPHYQSSRASSSSVSTTSGSSNYFRVRPNFLPGEIRSLPVHHALIETRDNQGHISPATVVHLDCELVRSIQEDQAWRLYQLHGTAGGQLTTPAKVVPHRALPAPAETPAAANGVVAADTGASAPGVAPPQPKGDQTSRSSPPTAEAHVPEWTAAMVERIVTALHIDAPTATALVTCAQQHGRDAAYLEDLLAYVQTAPTVRTPAAAFRRMVEANLGGQMPSSSETQAAREGT